MLIEKYPLETVIKVMTEDELREFSETALKQLNTETPKTALTHLILCLLELFKGLAPRESMGRDAIRMLDMIKEFNLGDKLGGKVVEFIVNYRDRYHLN